MPSFPRADVGDGIELQADAGSHGRYTEEEGESTRVLLDDASGGSPAVIKGVVRRGYRRRCGRSLCFGVTTAVLLALGSAGFALTGRGDIDDQDLAEGDGTSEAEVPVSRPDIDGWMAYHEKLEAKAAEKGADTRVLLLGDSITEELLGTSVGYIRDWGDPAVWQEYYEPLGTLNLGLSGDQTQHLLWRLQNGELPDSVRPESIMVMIGTNNLGYGMTPQETVPGIAAVVKYVTEQRPDALVLVMALFPRGSEDFWKPQMPWDGIDEVNELLEHTLMLSFGRNVRFVNCNDRFLVKNTKGQKLINDKLMMADYLHPTGEGLRVWSACVKEDIRSGLSDP